MKTMSCLLLFIAIQFNTQAFGKECTTAADCDDRLFCNGRELCAIPAGQTKGECRPARNMPCEPTLGFTCNEATNACERVMCRHDSQCFDEDPCDEVRVCDPNASGITFNPVHQVHGCKRTGRPVCLSNQTCRPPVERGYAPKCILPGCENPDKDRDGDDAIACGGSDCDDNDPKRRAGGIEVCDREDHDEDCNYETFGNLDRDKDGYPDMSCCNKDDDGKKYCGTDCHDTNNSIFPGIQMCRSEGDAKVLVCGRGEYNCGEGLGCYAQPNGTGLCLPTR